VPNASSTKPEPPPDQGALTTPPTVAETTFLQATEAAAKAPPSAKTPRPSRAEKRMKTQLTTLESHVHELTTRLDALETVARRWRDATRWTAILGLATIGLASIVATFLFRLPYLATAIILPTAILPLVGAVFIALHRVSARGAVFLTVVSFLLTYLGAIAGLYYLLSEVGG
jgi:hypothetical protein